MSEGASVFLDRIEGAGDASLAVLLLDDGRSFEIPTEWLPTGTAEGVWLRLVIGPDATKTREEAAHVDQLLNDVLDPTDDGGDIIL